MCISKNLSWSTHVNTVCSKAKQILRLLYRRFYNHSTSEVMLQLYLSLVRPHMEYAAAVWSPHLQKNIEALQSVQKLALRMIYHAWGMAYQELIGISSLPTLEERRVVMLLCLLYQIVTVNGFNQNTLTPSTSLSRHLLHSDSFCRFKHSFVPFTINLWNNLDHTIVSAPTPSCFKCCLVHSVSTCI